MRTVHVVTHPQATHHLDELVGGWFDSELTPAGLEDAAAIASRLRASIPSDGAPTLVSSDLSRAVAVADVIAQELGGLPVVRDPGFREKSYGVAEGRPQAWLDERFVPPPETGDRLDHDEGVPGAETRRVFATRVYAALERALRRDQSPDVVIVTHGFALTFVVAAWLRLPVDSLGYINLRSSAGGITTLREDDYFHNRQVVRLNDVTHLSH